MELVWAILVVFLIGLLAALAFSGWVVVSIIRFIARALVGGNRAGHAPRVAHAPQRIRCVQPGCRAENPLSARFCRRCGRVIGARQPAPLRQVAMW
jgi:hypothetical protein